MTLHVFTRRLLFSFFEKTRARFLRTFLYFFLFFRIWAKTKVVERKSSGSRKVKALTDANATHRCVKRQARKCQIIRHYELTMLRQFSLWRGWGLYSATQPPDGIGSKVLLKLKSFGLETVYKFPNVVCLSAKKSICQNTFA